MAISLTRYAPWVIVGSLAVAALFAITWYSRLFGLNPANETLFAPSPDRPAAQAAPTTADSARESLRERLQRIALKPRTEAQLEIERNRLNLLTVLPFDSIPAILDPQFISAQQADLSYEPDEKVLGVSINGDIRAYSVRFLSRHEIVNDTVGGVKIAVTW